MFGRKSAKSLRFVVAVAVGVSPLVGGTLVLGRAAAVPEVPRFSAQEAIDLGLIHTDGPELSIGELIDQSPVIVQGTVIATGEPRWNSDDGQDWTPEFLANPEAYDTVPMILTPVTIQVGHVFDVQGNSAEAPWDQVSSGATMEIWYPDDPRLDLTNPAHAELGVEGRTMLLAPGDKRVFFVDSRPFPVPVGTGPEIWRGDDYYGLWSYDADSTEVGPAAIEQVYSLRFAIVSGLLESSGLQVMTSAALTDLIHIERETPSSATVASFTLWPWEGTYEGSVAEVAPPPE